MEYGTYIILKSCQCYGEGETLADLVTLEHYIANYGHSASIYLVISY